MNYISSSPAIFIDNFETLIIFTVLKGVLLDISPLDENNLATYSRYSRFYHKIEE